VLPSLHRLIFLLIFSQYKLLYSKIKENSVFRPFANNLVSKATATQENQSVSNASNIGYVRYTLDLVCNKLFNGYAFGPPGDYPYAMVYDPPNGYIYVANASVNYATSRTIIVIKGATNTVIGEINIGGKPYCMAYDPQNGYIYVTNSANKVSVINTKTNTVIGCITVGFEPIGIVYDPQNGYIYVANLFGGTISIISTSPLYKVIFIENCLLTGTAWSVTLNGTT